MGSYLFVFVCFFVFELIISCLSPVLSHTIAHGSLFGLYGVTKAGLLRSFGENFEFHVHHSSSLSYSLHSFTHSTTSLHFTHSAGNNYETYTSVAAIGLAGGVAGIVQEGISHYTVHFEEHGIKRGWRAIQHCPPPAARTLLLSVPGSALGFLAYEFTKEWVMSKKDEGEEDA